MLGWLKRILVRWLLADHEGRIKDLERHFVTKRDPKTMQPIETLADVPLNARKTPKSHTAGMSTQQRLKWLEMTDGGRNLPQLERNG